MQYPDDMDQECIKLCDAMNSLPGVVTNESCCGHGVRPFRIFFTCTSFDSLLHLTRESEHESWKIECRHWNGNDNLGFILEGLSGGYSEANALAEDLIGAHKS